MPQTQHVATCFYRTMTDGRVSKSVAKHFKKEMIEIVSTFSARAARRTIKISWRGRRQDLRAAGNQDDGPVQLHPLVIPFCRQRRNENFPVAFSIVSDSLCR
jgi:hypothetical protein